MYLHRSNFRRLVVLCLFCVSTNALAVKPPPLPGRPHYSIQHFGEHFGLGSATILTMAQDSQGFLWIGTETGLFRYDGNGVKRFGRAEVSPRIRDLVTVAPDGNLWVRALKPHASFVNPSISSHFPWPSARSAMATILLPSTSAGRFSFRPSTVCCASSQIRSTTIFFAPEAAQSAVMSPPWRALRTTRSGSPREVISDVSGPEQRSLRTSPISI